MEHGYKTQTTHPGNLPGDAVKCRVLTRCSRVLCVLQKIFGL